jgi:hypothetical protein
LLVGVFNTIAFTLFAYRNIFKAELESELGTKNGLSAFGGALDVDWLSSLPWITNPLQGASKARHGLRLRPSLTVGCLTAVMINPQTYL